MGVRETALPLEIMEAKAKELWARSWLRLFELQSSALEREQSWQLLSVKQRELYMSSEKGSGKKDPTSRSH